MISTAKDYAKTLRELNIAANIVGQADDIFTAVPQIAEEFANPSISLASKHNVIEKVFPLQIRDFLKLLCDNSDTGLWKDIVKAYREAAPERKGEFVVTLKYVTAPDDEQLQGIKDFVAKQYNTTEFTFELEEDKTLGGGFVIQAGNDVFDWSTNGRMKQFREQLAKADIGATASTENIISILKSEIDNFELEAQDKEVGVVSYVGDGIANINGIDHAAYGEIVIFDCGVKGMVQDVRKDEIGCILFGRDTEIKEGSRVARTGKRAGIPVGEGFLGRIIDALGAPIDGAGPVKDNGYRPIEQPAPSIVDRKSVSVPMETGILAIDSMFPIGRGQRELIIGDRQTGKTSIATDTIIKMNLNTHEIEDIPNRQFLYNGQTPQAFKLSVIREAYKRALVDPNFKTTDDCGVVLKYMPDIPIGVVPGEKFNMKLTHKEDLFLLDKLFQLKSVSDVSLYGQETALEHKVIVIFGGSYGIGHSIAELCTGLKAKVYSFSRSETGTDVADASLVKEALEKVYLIEKKIDFVINTAGILLKIPLMTMKYDDILNLIRVNYLGAINVAKESFSYLAKSHGGLLLFTSSSYTRGRAMYSLYSSSKAAIVNLVQALSEEWKSYNIKINCINPERTKTPMRIQNFGIEPENSLLSPQFVAETSIMTLLSGLTGQVIDVRRKTD